MMFGSNFKKKKSLAILVIVFFFCGMGYSIFKVNQTKLVYLVNHQYFADPTQIFSEYYADQNTRLDFLIAPEIPSDVINSTTVKLFIPIFHHERNRLTETVCPLPEATDTGTALSRTQKREHWLSCYHGYHQVALNGQPLTVTFKRAQHPRTRQAGIIAYIDLHQIPPGPQQLTVEKALSQEPVMGWMIDFYLSQDT